MATSFLYVNKADVPTTYDAARYTVGTDLYAAISEIRLANKTASAVTASVELYPAGVSASNIVIASAYSIPAKKSLIIKGFLALLTDDELHVKAGTSSALDLNLTGLEQDTTDSKIVQGYKRNVTNSGYDTVFTGPASDVMVNDILCVNKSGAAVTVTLRHVPLSGDTIILAQEQSISANGGRYVHTGTVGVVSADTIQAQCSAASALDILLSGTI